MSQLSPIQATQANRVGLGDAVIMGLSGSGPAQTLAVSLAGLVAADRVASTLRAHV